MHEQRRSGLHKRQTAGNWRGFVPCESSPRPLQGRVRERVGPGAGFISAARLAPSDSAGLELTYLSRRAYSEPEMKSPPPLSHPRKLPSQERSRSTVASILQAAAEVLAQSGAEQTSVAAVVRRAGVSAGTFYQYFPNKEALLAALLRHQLDAVRHTVRDEVRRARASLPAQLLAVTQASIGAWRSAAPLLLAAKPSAGRANGDEACSGTAETLLEHFTAAAPHLPPRRLKLLALISDALVCTLAQRIATDAPELLDGLEDELMLLLTSCLQGPGTAGT